jgi:FHA domain
MPDTLSGWTEEFCRLTPEGFMKAYPDPFLIVVDTNAVPLEGDGRPIPSGSTEAFGFLTSRIEKNGALANALDPGLHIIRKREDGKNVFAMMITLGRAENNDIVIRHQSISKFHASFSEFDGKWQVRDANSRNGTFLGEKQLSSEEAVVLEDTNEIRFAGVQCRFLHGTNIKHLLAGEAQRRGLAD